MKESFSNKNDQAKKQDVFRNSPWLSLLPEDSLILCWASCAGRETSSIQDQLGKKEPSNDVKSRIMAFFSILKPSHNLGSSVYFSWHTGFSSITRMYTQLSKKPFRHSGHRCYSHPFRLTAFLPFHLETEIHIFHLQTLCDPKCELAFSISLCTSIPQALCTIQMYLKIYDLVFQIPISNNSVEMQNTLTTDCAVSKTLSMWYLTDISVFFEQASWFFPEIHTNMF